MEDRNSWLQRLAANKTPIACTLLSRRIIESPQSKGDDQMLKKNKDQKIYSEPIDKHLEQGAICYVKYRPARAIFRQDLGSFVVQNGLAALSSGIHIDIPSMPTVDGSTKLSDLKADVNYLDDLASDEYIAFKQRKGIWSKEVNRSQRPDLVDEAEFEMSAGVMKKLWRRLTQRY